MTDARWRRRVFPGQSHAAPKRSDIAMDKTPFRKKTTEDRRGGVQTEPDAQPDKLSTPAHGHDDITALYNERAPQLTATLRKMFGNGPPDPEDVTQQAFQKLMERADRSDIRDLNAFLWRTARNLFLKEKRKDDVRSRHDFEIEHLFFPQNRGESSPEGVLSAKQELIAINEVLRKMPERRRRAFILHFVEGMPVAAVARRLKIARSPTQRHIQYASQDIEIYLASKKRSRRP